MNLSIQYIQVIWAFRVTRKMSNSKNNDVDAHLADLEDGAGCTEIWQKLSEERAQADSE